MNPLRYSTHHVTEADIAAVVGVMRSDWLTCGPKIEEFEAALCAYTGARYAVAVSSGTAALHLAYLASGVTRVVTSPLTFVATANAALLAGAQVSFHDVDSVTGNVVTLRYHGWHGRTRLVLVPVHFAGRAAPLPETGVVIEDAAHALGAMDFDGCSRVGSCAHSLATCFSCHPVKPITTLGEGGAVTTNDQGFADEVRSLRSHGREGGLMVRLGLNYRMTDAAAAMGIEQLKRCDEGRERRCELARDYDGELGQECFEFAHGSPGGTGPMRYSTHAHGCESWIPCRDAHHLYPVRIKHGRRDEVKAKLNAQGIGAQIHYSPIVPLMPYYRARFGYAPGMWPEAEAWSAETLSLPLHAGLREQDVERVVDALREALS